MGDNEVSSGLLSPVGELTTMCHQELSKRFVEQSILKPSDMR